MTATHLLIHRYMPGAGPQPGTTEHDEEMKQWAEIDARLRADGMLVGAYAVQDRGVEVSPSGSSEWHAEGEITFAVHAITTDSDEAAAETAQSMPTAAYGTIEVRPLMDAS